MKINQKGIVHIQLVVTALFVFAVIGLASLRVIKHNNLKHKNSPVSAIQSELNSDRVVKDIEQGTPKITETSPFPNPITTGTSSTPTQTQNTTNEKKTSSNQKPTSPSPNPYITQNGLLSASPSHISLESNSDGAAYYFGVTNDNSKSLTSIWVVSSPSEISVFCCNMNYGWSGVVWQKSNTSAGSGTVKIAGTDTTGGTYTGSFTVSWSALRQSSYGY